MRSEPAGLAIAPPDQRSAGGLAGYAAALAEVIAAFVCVHVTYRSFKHFTAAGRAEIAARLNFSAGTTMILFTVLVLLLARRNFGAYGLTRRDWRYNLNIGLVWAVLFIVVAGSVIRFSRIPFDPLHPPDMARALVAALGEISNTLLLLWFLLRPSGVLSRLPAVVSLLLLFGLLSIPVILAAYFGRPVVHELLSVLWLFFGAGFGEEIFFRGYIQSRLNQAFGRSFRFLGAEFGWGLFVSAALFGFIHVLNTVDYFGGRYEFAWWWWLPNFASGLFFGLLRERTGSILAGAVIHGLTDVAARVPALLP